MFFSELSLFASLPRMLTAEKLLQDDVPDFVYLSLAGLQVLLSLRLFCSLGGIGRALLFVIVYICTLYFQKIKKHYGNKSPEFVSATRVLNIAVPAVRASIATSHSLVSLGCSPLLSPAVMFSRSADPVRVAHGAGGEAPGDGVPEKDRHPRRRAWRLRESG